MTGRRVTPARLLGLAKQAVLAVVVSAALYAGSRWVLNLDIAYALFLVVVLAVLAGRALVTAVRPPPPTTTLIREDTSARVFGRLPDRPFAGARRWEERLELIRGDGAYFRRAVLPDLAALVDARLDTSGETEREKELLGEQVWEFFTAAGPRRAPTPAELAAIVAKLEELWAQPR